MNLFNLIVNLKISITLRIIINLTLLNIANHLNNNNIMQRSSKLTYSTDKPTYSQVSGVLIDMLLASRKQ